MPDLIVTFERAGDARITGPLGRTYRGSYEINAGVWAPGTRASHTVGVHGTGSTPRLAIVQQGTERQALGHRDERGVWQADERGYGWRGLNIHDLRGPLAGCVGVSARTMLDLLGEIQEWTQTAHPPTIHHDTGWPILTVEVRHA